MGSADGGLRDGGMTTGATWRAISSKHEHWRTSNGQDLRAYSGLLTSCALFPKYCILFEAQFPYL